jgi:hypothetical protein
MNKSKLFFILTAAVLLILTACSGTFEDPGSGGSSNPFIGALQNNWWVYKPEQ